MMNIVVQWGDDDQSVLRWDFGQRWNQDDLMQAQSVADEMIQYVDHVVDFVFNFEDCLSLPKNAFNHLRYILRNQPSNRGVVILVGCNRFIEVMFKNFSKFHKEFGEGMVFVEAMNEANEILAIDDVRVSGVND